MRIGLLLILIAVVAAADWWAVAVDRRDVERVLKPATMGLLVVLAATAGDPPGDVRAWLVAGAICGLVGDVALLGDGDTPFMVGLVAFAIGHVAYASAALATGFDPIWALPGVAVSAVLLGVRFVPRILPGARAQGGGVLAAAVGVYAGVISVMVVTAWATGSIVAALGAMSFAASDWVLGHQRFVGPLPGRRLAVMIPYHVGQTLLIVGLT